MVRGIIDALLFYSTFYADIATKPYDMCVCMKRMGAEYAIQQQHKLYAETGSIIIFMSKKCAFRVLFYP